MHDTRGTNRIRSTANGRATWWLVGLEGSIALAAVYGGIGLIVTGMGMPLDWLADTPFHSWVWPGVFLLLIIAVPMGAAAMAETARSRCAFALTVGAGLAQIGWIAVQLIVLQRFFFLQPVLLVGGVAVVALGYWSHRRQPQLPTAGDTGVGSMAE